MPYYNICSECRGLIGVGHLSTCSKYVKRKKYMDDSHEGFAWSMGVLMGLLFGGFMGYAITDSHWEYELKNSCSVSEKTISFVFDETAYEVKCSIVNKIDMKDKP
jgi:hypothetical protein